MDDELLRRAAMGEAPSRFASPSRIRRYRTCCALFVVVALSVMARLLF